jgi:hypothetical protein
MEIIDRLETEARGVYSGTLGYFGLSGGADLCIVIRTAVRQGDTLSIGAGGAIVLDSTPQGEYEEMLLKASTSLRAYRPAVLAGSMRSSETVRRIPDTDVRLNGRTGKAYGGTQRLTG